MKKLVTKKFLLSLAWISSGEKIPNYYTVVFALKSPESKNTLTYVDFSFTSFDLMYTHLRNLSKTFVVSSIDSLSKGQFPVTVSYFERFDLPPAFEYLYISEGNIWPNKTIKGHFVIN